MIVIMRFDFPRLLAKLPSRKRRFAAGAEVLGIDATVENLYFVACGLVHLQRAREDGEVVILQRAEKGMILAEASVFSTHYHCSAIALQQSELLVYPMRAVQQQLSEAPEAALAFARHLATQVRIARKRAEILALKTVHERLQAWLIWNHGVLPAKGRWYHVAEEIGVSKEALYREMAKRRKQKGAMSGVNRL